MLATAAQHCCTITLWACDAQRPAASTGLGAAIQHGEAGATLGRWAGRSRAGLSPNQIGAPGPLPVDCWRPPEPKARRTSAAGAHQLKPAYGKLAGRGARVGGMPLLNRKEAWKPLAQPEGLQAEEEVRMVWLAPRCSRPAPLSSPQHRDLQRWLWPRRRSCPGAGPQPAPAPAPSPPTQQRRCTPDSLPPLPQVWHIESTGEVFRSYEAYLQRMELYKQGVWSCKYTGKGGLTFEEAQQAEAKAVKQLDSVRHWAGPQTAAAPAQLLPGPVFQPLWETGWQPQPTATAAAARSCRWQAGG